MNNPSAKLPVPWKIVVPGLLVVLIMFALLVSTVFGAGGRFFSSKPDALPSTSKADPETALLAQVNGWIEVQDETGAWTPAEAGQSLPARSRIRSGDLSSARLTLFDGSVVTLSANSELSIDELDAQKEGRSRVVVMTQWIGASEHQVAPNQAEDSTYEVHSPAGVGQAKGTVFQVLVTPDLTAHFYVIEGIVAVTNLEITVLVNPGEVSTVVIDQAPQDPVVSISGQGRVSQTGEAWTIAGQSFTLRDNTAIFGDPQVGDWVEFKGRRLADGTQVLDWILLVQATPENRFSLRGVVESIGDLEWIVNGQAITVDGTTEIDGGIQPRANVSVEGSIQSDGGLLASEIRLLDEELGLPFSFIGVIQSQGEAEWTVSGRVVAIQEGTELSVDLSVGEVVRVTGWIHEDGAWLAGEIERIDELENEFEFTGEIENMDPWQVAGIALEIREWTEIEAGLEIGDLVHVEGSIDEEGNWIAAEIEFVSPEELSSMVLVGAVISIDPWVVSGIPLQVTDTTVIEGEITVGMLVRVEILLAEDGAWQIIRIEPLEPEVWMPGCMDLIAEVIAIDGSQIQLANWPLLTLSEEVVIDGDLTPGSVINFRLCFDEDQTLVISYIIIVVPGEEDTEVEEPDQEGDKVYVCHKPDKKKGGHTLHISRSALPAHLGHGDYEGQCR